MTVLTRAALLSAIAAAALGVRLWGIDFGLPVISSRPDEMILVQQGLRFFGGDFRPTLSNYPSLCMYALHGLFRAYVAFSLASGRAASDIELLAAFRIDASPLILIARCMSAILGAATTLILYRLARSLYGERTAFLAALFLALAYLHVRESHFGVTDIPTTFLITCAVACIQHLRVRPTWQSYAIAGMVAGLAASAKYAGLFLVAPLLVEHLVNAGDTRVLWRRLFDARLLVFGLFMLACFVAGTPYALTDPSSYYQGFLYESRHLLTGHAGIRNLGWWQHLSFTLFFGLGWPLLLAAGVGLFLALRTDWRAAISWVTFPVLYFLIVGRGATTFVRYLVPVVPFLCLAAAFAVTRLSRGSLVALLGLAVITLWPSMTRVVAVDSRLARADTRVLAREWLAHEARSGERVYQSSRDWGRVLLPPTLEQLARAVRSTPSYNAAVKAIFNAQVEYRRKLAFPELIDQSLAKASDQGPKPDLVILIESPLQPDPVPPEVLDLVRHGYALAATFQGCDPATPAERYDRQDAFYLPFSSFAGVERPGPNIAIYRRDSPR